jgi:hypothetical protein
MVWASRCGAKMTDSHLSMADPLAGLVAGLPGVVPAHPGLIAAGDVVDVEQDLVFALLVPDLPAGVAGVAQDGADGALGPVIDQQYTAANIAASATD